VIYNVLIGPSIILIIIIIIIVTITPLNTPKVELQWSFALTYIHRLTEQKFGSKDMGYSMVLVKTTWGTHLRTS
jgi:hypothetical protein